MSGVFVCKPRATWCEVGLYLLVMCLAHVGGASLEHCLLYSWNNSGRLNNLSTVHSIILQCGYLLLLINWDVHHDFDEPHDAVSHHNASTDLPMYCTCVELWVLCGNLALHHCCCATRVSATLTMVLCTTCACGTSATPTQPEHRPPVHGAATVESEWYSESSAPLGSGLCVKTRTWMILSVNCKLLNLHGLEHCPDHRHLSPHNDWHVNNLVQELHQWSLHRVLPMLRCGVPGSVEKLTRPNHSVDEPNLRQLDCSLFDLGCPTDLSAASPTMTLTSLSMSCTSDISTVF